MRMVWYVLLVVVVCLPLALVSLLAVAAFSPRMDRLTLALPSDVRTTIAALAMNKAGYGKSSELKIQRVLKLDPANAEGHSRMCQIASKSARPGAVETCLQAVRLQPSPGNYNWLGQAQETTANFCAAEDSFTSANSRGGNPDYLRAMGRNALRCGRIAYSLAELNAAEDIDAKSVAGSSDDPDELADEAADLRSDREWLTLAYTAARQPKAASEACSRAYPEWKFCACVLRDGKADCTGQPVAPAK